MRRFLYYLPNRDQPGGQSEADRIRAAGLGERFGLFAADRPTLEPPTNFARQAVARGPDGQAGLLVSPTQGGGCIYAPDAQSWIDCGGWWLGWNIGDRPTPRDLERADPIRGQALPLGDGQLWTIPVARLLPQIRRWDPAHQAFGAARDPRYDWLWTLTETLRARWWDPLDAADMPWRAAGALYHARVAALQQAPETEQKAAEKELADALATIERLYEARRAAAAAIDPVDTVAVLAVNYRVGPEEVSALDLLRIDPATGLSTDGMILDVLVDGDGIRAARQKKTAPDGAAD